MLVYFSSVSGFTQQFIEKLDVPAIRIPLSSAEAEKFLVTEDYILVTPSYGAASKGFVPKQVIKFLNNPDNRKHIQGVIGTGNLNFYEDYCKGATIISEKCNVPVLYRLELAGTEDDVEAVSTGLDLFWGSREIDSKKEDTLSGK